MSRLVRKRLFIILLLLGLGMIAGESGCRQGRVFKETRCLMGTIVSIEMAGVSRRASSVFFDAAWKEAERLEKLFSSYLAESEVCRINQAASGGPSPVSTEMLVILRRARELGDLTGGAFDVTVGPLMELWGFFPERAGKVPGPAEIEKARALVDWRAVEVDPVARTVRFPPGMKIDLSGLAKGYVVDKIAALLVENGVKNALINAGGDIYCLGHRPGGESWRIGVEHPRREGDILMILKLRDQAVASSGDYRNYFIRNRKRYSHIIDPRSGRPAAGSVTETSILASDCVSADALATAVFVLGEVEGLRLVNELPDVEGIIVTEVEGDIKIHLSEGLKQGLSGSQSESWSL